MKKILSKIHSIKLCLLCVIFSISQFISSAYLVNVPITLTQPNGTKIECFATGDEFYNWVHDENGYTIIQNDNTGYYCYAVISGDQLEPSEYIVGQTSPKSVGLTPGINISKNKIQKKRDAFIKSVQTNNISYNINPKSQNKVGHMNNIVIYIRFADQTEFTSTQSTYTSMFNNQQGNSMRNYFKESSYGKLDIESHFYPTNNGTTILSYKDPHSRDYYCPYNATTNPNGYKSQSSREHELLTNAINSIKKQIPSSLNIDCDNDGYVDNICFIIKGGVTANNTLLWPHKWALYSQTVKINNKIVYTYNVQLDDRLNNRKDVGVLCHEMGHTLGAPDLYHPNDYCQPVGIWDIMANDQNPPQQMSAYIKNKYLGWISDIPTIVTSGTYNLKPLSHSTNNCYKLPITGSSEYLILEYRQKKGLFEKSIPNSGLIIYRINENYNGNYSGSGYGGVSDEIYVFRPDGTIYSDGIISQACFSDSLNRTSFNNFTNPFCFTSTNSLGNICINNITEIPNGTLDFNIRFCDGDNIVYSNTNKLPPITNACNSIKTSGEVIINQNENIIFEAGEEIILNPGFKMANNSSLEMRIK